MEVKYRDLYLQGRIAFVIWNYVQFLIYGISAMYVHINLKKILASQNYLVIYSFLVLLLVESTLYLLEYHFCDQGNMVIPDEPG